MLERIRERVRGERERIRDFNRGREAVGESKAVEDFSRELEKKGKEKD